MASAAVCARALQNLLQLLHVNQADVFRHGGLISEAHALTLRSMRAAPLDAVLIESASAVLRLLCDSTAPLLLASTKCDSMTLLAEAKHNFPNSHTIAQRVQQCTTIIEQRDYHHRGRGR